MGNFRNNMILFITLTGSSVVIYLIQYAIFKNPANTVFYFFQDMAFVPIQVLLVTLLINKFLSISEKQRKTKKINVMISTFFVETGVEIMIALARFDENHRKECQLLKLEEVIHNNGKGAKKIVAEFEYRFHVEPEKLGELAGIMDKNRGFFLSLLENPNLLEHEAFTDMLWAVFHVADELKTRGELSKISKLDADHIAVDLNRAYKAMVVEWIGYINYLKVDYPFLYTIAIRKNPFRLEKEGLQHDV